MTGMFQEVDGTGPGRVTQVVLAPLGLKRPLPSLTPQVRGCFCPSDLFLWREAARLACYYASRDGPVPPTEAAAAGAGIGLSAAVS
jgi:hypothetical protein